MGFLDRMRSTSSKSEYENGQSELAEAKLKIDDLQSQLNDRERLLNAARAEVERLKLADSTANMGSDERLAEYIAALKQRDDRIADLKAKIENIAQKKDKELAAINQKMQFIMDEKDKKIKRLNALGADAKEDDGVRRAIAAEANRQPVDPNKLPKVAKTQSESDLIFEALMSNTFMANMAQSQLQKIVDAMERREHKKNEDIIKEGEEGTHMFVLEKGAVQVTKGQGKDKTVVCDLSPGMLFGELAILYNCRRTASIKCKTDCSLWAMERTIFQSVVKLAGQAKDEEKFNHLSTVKDLKQFPESKLRKIADCLEEETFGADDLIFKEGASGDFFYIIRSGEVDITKNNANGGEDNIVVLGPGESFGEKALIREDKRNANARAKTEVKCYTLDRKAFTTLVGGIGDQEKEKEEPKADASPVRKAIEQVATCNFNDLKIIKPLGAGGFGLVKLVTVKGVDDRAFALKCIQKHRVVQYGQQRHIMDEKNILAIMESPFILGLHRTFKDTKFVYLLTDAYLGGDLWRTLHVKGPFNDATGRFYIACVVEAFDYLHKRHYCYRDLKPENLMVDNNGYVRLVDLGFAKKVPPGHKTWTFCGTPEYIPPEIISNTGHNIAADYWSLGILIFELLSKRTPFRAKDDLAIYEGILRGIHSVQFPYKISRKAESIIKALCRQDPSERIGYQRSGLADIRKHRWFQGFDWDALRAETLPAPHKPEIKGIVDVSNFEKIREDDHSKIPEEHSGWDAEF